MAQLVNTETNLKGKVGFEKFCGHIGAIARPVFRAKKVPVVVASCGDPFFNEANVRVLKRRIADMNVRRNVSEHELIECD